MVNETFANAEWIIAKVPPEEQASLRNEFAQLRERQIDRRSKKLDDRSYDWDGEVLKKWAADFDVFFAKIRTVLSPAEQSYLQNGTTPALSNLRGAFAKLEGVVGSLVPVLPHEERELPTLFPEVCKPLVRVDVAEEVERNMQWVADQIRTLTVVLEQAISRSQETAAPQEQ